MKKYAITLIAVLCLMMTACSGNTAAPAETTAAETAAAAEAETAAETAAETETEAVPETETEAAAETAAQETAAASDKVAGEGETVEAEDIVDENAVPVTAADLKDGVYTPDSFTWKGAEASFEEDRKGRIAPGQLADFVILAQDPFETKGKDLHTIPVKATVIDGQCVYGGI